MSTKDATKTLKSFKVEYSGDGTTVSYQSPGAGERILEGEIVKLLLTD